MEAHPVDLLSLMHNRRYFTPEREKKVDELVSYLTRSKVTRTYDWVHNGLNEVWRQILQERYPALADVEIPALSGEQAWDWIVDRMGEEEYERILEQNHDATDVDRAIYEAGARIFAEDMLSDPSFGMVADIKPFPLPKKKKGQQTQDEPTDDAASSDDDDDFWYSSDDDVFGYSSDDSSSSSDEEEERPNSTRSQKRSRSQDVGEPDDNGAKRQKSAARSEDDNS